jgi:hypothetical protein
MIVFAGFPAGIAVAGSVPARPALIVSALVGVGVLLWNWLGRRPVPGSGDPVRP